MFNLVCRDRCFRFGVVAFSVVMVVVVDDDDDDAFSPNRSGRRDGPVLGVNRFRSDLDVCLRPSIPSLALFQNLMDTAQEVVRR